jgi:phosphoglycerol transferase MdoB-like AlkP superfamily enzyme
MKHFFTFLAKIIAFWFCFFALGRLYFLLYNHQALAGVPFVEVLATFYHALYLDFATICYILAFSWIFWTFQFWIFPKTLHKIHFYFQLFLVLVSAIIFSSEVELYAEWKTKINYAALQHLRQNPLEVWEISSTKNMLTSTLLTLIFLCIGYFGLKKVFQGLGKFSAHPIFKLLIWIALLPGIIYGLRGGYQPIPISQSDVYFSKHTVLNHAAVNSCWNIGQSIDATSLDVNKYQKMALNLAQRETQRLLTQATDTHIAILNQSKPNIVVFILESWSADALNSLGGKWNAAPFLDSLAQEGLLFNQAISSGSLSDEGMGSIFSGFPALTIPVVVNSYDKYKNLPFLPNALQEIGYFTSYYSGIDLAYGNIGAYLMDKGIQVVKQEKDFPKVPKKDRGRLGIHDHAMLPIFLQALSTQQEPFLSAFFSMSSHSPYDFPDKNHYIDATDEVNYLHGVRFTDNHLRIFFQHAKKEPWYKNTLFIFVADHSHVTPSHYDYYSSKHHHIPLVFYGEVLQEKYRKTTQDHFVNHHDLPKTLLLQLGLAKEAEKFVWSRDMFSKGEEFAYYAFTDGAGIVTPKGQFAYDYPSGHVNESWQENTTDLEKENQKNQVFAYLQALIDDYMQLGR